MFIIRTILFLRVRKTYLFCWPVDYFFSLLRIDGFLGIGGLGDWDFLGRPIGALRTASNASGGYRSSLRIGFIPALSSLLWAVSYGIFSSSAICCMVKPVMVIGYLSAKKTLKKGNFSLDISVQMLDTIN
jgi:hypothetical protein